MNKKEGSITYLLSEILDQLHEFRAEIGKHHEQKRETQSGIPGNIGHNLQPLDQDGLSSVIGYFGEEDARNFIRKYGVPGDVVSVYGIPIEHFAPFRMSLFWKPIETVPIDTNIIIAYDGLLINGTVSIAHRWGRDWMANVLPGLTKDIHPTHWMPLPEPPSGAEE